MCQRPSFQEIICEKFFRIFLLEVNRKFLPLTQILPSNRIVINQIKFGDCNIRFIKLNRSLIAKNNILELEASIDGHYSIRSIKERDTKISLEKASIKIETLLGKDSYSRKLLEVMKNAEHSSYLQTLLGKMIFLKFHPIKKFSRKYKPHIIGEFFELLVYELLNKLEKENYIVIKGTEVLYIPRRVNFSNQSLAIRPDFIIEKENYRILVEAKTNVTEKTIEQLKMYREILADLYILFSFYTIPARLRSQITRLGWIVIDNVQSISLGNIKNKLKDLFAELEKSRDGVRT